MRKKHIRMVAGVILSLCMLLMICSCGKTDKPRTLTFASWYTEDDVLAYRDIAAKYHELYPNVTIEFITLDRPGNDHTVYAELAMEAIKEGEADLVLLHPSVMPMIYDRGWVGEYLEDVSQSPLFKQYSSTMQQLVTGADGTAYGYPSFMSFVGLLANTDLLKECGIDEIPATYSEWVASMELVKEAGYIPFASYNGNEYSSMFLISAMAEARVFYGETAEDAGAYDVFAPAITELSNLLDTGLLEKDGDALAGGRNRDIVEKSFPQGNIAYTICPSWYIPQLQKAAPDFNYQLSAIPASDSGPIVNIRAGWPVGVSASSKYHDEILRFLSFALLPENMELLAGSKGNVNPLKNSTTGNEIYGAVLGSVHEGAVYSDSMNKYGFDLVETLNHISQLLYEGTSLSQTLAEFEVVIIHQTANEGR